ncbi:thermonuclease family protein [Mycoplasmopsis gallinacea]|uniref:TNase-like domain-containing protein n=1 Tax=Mycoplasmopsis gallinacea TaxID=29556 RepID=A0A6H0V4E6_9BACT|nr:thermonuclease family protein [Mycoplasmopsis gallinacea]QIW62604.1 hypothetical protein GOQ20_04310 [Mycoplasmopsis gallinacea]
MQSTKLEKVKLLKVLDGDTVKIDLKDKTITVRLFAIDTPETLKLGINDEESFALYENAWGEVAKKEFMKLLKKHNNKDLFYLKISADKYHREVGILFFKENLDIKDSINYYLVANGLARVAYFSFDKWKSPFYLKNEEQRTFVKELLNGQSQAVNNKMGFWKAGLQNVFAKEWK